MPRAFSRLLPALLAALLLAGTLAACNTARGVGEDLSAAGGAIKDTAEDAKQ